MQRLEVSGAVRPIYRSLGVKRLNYVVQSLGVLQVTPPQQAIPFLIPAK